ncbi:MAG: ATP-dependent DNA helicase RecG [Deltaproteobacteria bacterium]|nr:MAG: ATP-dependent DNA helicase RecG [Deltaproteobacteria bacterium]
MIAKKDTPLKQIQKLTLPLTRLKGIGPKRATFLAQKGLHTVLDLLFFIPFRYEDRTRVSPIRAAEEGLPVLVKGTVVSGREERFYPSHKRLFKVVLRDKDTRLGLLWFQYKKPHLTKYATPGLELFAYGRIQTHRGQRQMVHPEIILADAQETQSEKGGLGFYPVYPAVPGISANLLRSMIRKALDEHLTALVDPIPEEITRRLGLPHLGGALEQAHFPSEESSTDELNQCDTPFQRRLIFDRFFLVMLTMAFRKRFKETRTSPTFSIPSRLRDDLKKFFPFRLTSHQTRAIEDMVSDLTKGKCMNRLLLGDVGCGKTVIAAVAAYISVRNDHQVAIMVPTQELANQHFEYFLKLAPKMAFRPVLLTGKLKKSERQDIYEKIWNEKYNLVIGTQSLIQKGLRFPSLGLVIIDEQQRFGVRERASMDPKGENPHILVMTATPIPRTLAIGFYGDMDLSFIQEFPEGHKPVITHLVTESEKRSVFETLKQRMSAGQQAFVICPVIEGSEELDLKNALEMAEKLKKIFQPPFRIGLVHGRLSSDEREKVMEDFRKGRIHLLVGTTVIEVGVHVPRATVMVIEHPERFGLAQLHQLRGRVGRGKERGLCLLMTSSNLPERSRSRLEILVENHDGFEIAKKDLSLRGLGELTGTRQAGMGEFDLTEMVREPELLLAARREAYGLIDSDPELVLPGNSPLKAMVESILAKPLDL